MEGWQSCPVLNIFKACGVEAKKDVEMSGKVSSRMDEVIHKQVFRISGSIPAVNYLKLPGKAKSLSGATGRFLYLQVRFEERGALFSVHVELHTADGNTCRVSLGNIFKAEALKKKAGCVQYSLPDPPQGWTLLALDLCAAAAGAGPGAAAYAGLKSLQLCASLTVRSAFCSDARFGLQSLPREMVLSHCLDASQLSQVWVPAEPTDVAEPRINKPILPKRKPSASRRQATLPRPDTSPEQAADQAPTAAAAASAATAAAAARTGAVGGRAVCATGSASRNGAATPPVHELSGLSLASEPSCASSSTCGPSAAAAAFGGVSVGRQRPLQPEPFMALARVNGFTGEYCRAVLYCAATDELVFPAGSLVVAMAATPHQQHPAAADGHLQQQQQPPPAAATRQRFFLGHSAFVCCLALGGQGGLLATGQEGKQPLIRLWDFGRPAGPHEDLQQQGAGAGAGGKCLAVLCAHASNLAALDVSADGRALVACGCDAQARQTIALWDITGLRQGGQARLLVRTVTTYHVRLLAFSPFEPDHFVAAGRDSVRLYRLRGEALRGISVKLQAPLTPSGQVVGGAAPSVVSGPKVFTAIAFEASPAGLQLPRQHMFVASAAGAVFQVDYASRALTAVYQLHAGSINSLALGDGLALTASDDATLRLWPLDFAAPLLEAAHEGPLTSGVLASGDGLVLVVGGEGGGLGRLDVLGRRHELLLSSHCGRVGGLEVHPSGRPTQYLTTSTDGSVRIWDACSHRQLLEFCSSSSSSSCRSSAGGISGAAGVATCAAFRPDAYQLAVGFQGGLVRLCNVATSQVLQERQQHQGPIAQLLFTPDGSRLLSCGSDGRVVAYDTREGAACTPLKTLTTPPCTALAAAAAAAAAGGVAGSGARGSRFGRRGGPGVCAAVSGDGLYVAVGEPAPAAAAAGGSGGGDGCIVLCSVADGLEARLRIECPVIGFERCGASHGCLALSEECGALCQRASW